MREIKFRGKRVDNGEWVYGSYVFIKDFDGDYHAITDDGCVHKVVAPETVGQFTGLKDKNGKEIYEGDIIELDAFYDEFQMPGGTGYWEWQRAKTEVFFENGYFAAEEGIPLDHVEDYWGIGAEEEHPFPEDYESGLIVTGNIHELIES